MKFRIALGDVTIDEKLLLIKYLQDTLHITRPKAYLLLRGEKFYCNMDNDEMCKFISNIQYFHSNIEWFREEIETTPDYPIFNVKCPEVVLLDPREFDRVDWFHGGNPPCNRHKKHKKR